MLAELLVGPNEVKYCRLDLQLHLPGLHALHDSDRSNDLSRLDGTGIPSRNVAVAWRESTREVQIWSFRPDQVLSAIGSC